MLTRAGEAAGRSLRHRGGVRRRRWRTRGPPARRPRPGAVTRRASRALPAGGGRRRDAVARPSLVVASRWQPAAAGARPRAVRAARMDLATRPLVRADRQRRSPIAPDGSRLRLRGTDGTDAPSACGALGPYAAAGKLPGTEGGARPVLLAGRRVDCLTSAGDRRHEGHARPAASRDHARDRTRSLRGRGRLGRRRTPSSSHGRPRAIPRVPAAGGADGRRERRVCRAASGTRLSRPCFPGGRAVLFAACGSAVQRRRLRSGPRRPARRADARRGSIYARHRRGLMRLRRAGWRPIRRPIRPETGVAVSGAPARDARGRAQSESERSRAATAVGRDAGTLAVSRGRRRRRPARAGRRSTRDAALTPVRPCWACTVAVRRALAGWPPPSRWASRIGSGAARTSGSRSSSTGTYDAAHLRPATTTGPVWTPTAARGVRSSSSTPQRRTCFDRRPTAAARPERAAARRARTARDGSVDRRRTRRC